MLACYDFWFYLTCLGVDEEIIFGEDWEAILSHLPSCLRLGLGLDDLTEAYRHDHIRHSRLAY